MTVVATTKRTTRTRSGIHIRGTIRVRDGRRTHTVRYEAGPHGHQMQWGAPTDVLCFTWNTFKNLIAEEVAL